MVSYDDYTIAFAYDERGRVFEWSYSRTGLNEAALKPQATAIASRRVDFPEPLSPTKKVIFW